VGLLFIIALGFGYVSFDLYLQTKKALQKQAEADRTSSEIIQNNKELAAAASNGIRQQAFGWFLLAWHQGRVDEAEDIRSSFPEDSQEFAAMLFLLDERPLISKEDEFRQIVGKEKSDFANFVVGEYYFKQGNTTEALKAYQQCDLDKVGSWLGARIKARLKALTAASGKMIGSFQGQLEKEEQD
jgi:tetratricopeptide (TPR) repeat protein